jgi:hypothetical protein
MMLAWPCMPGKASSELIVSRSRPANVGDLLSLLNWDRPRIKITALADDLPHRSWIPAHARRACITGAIERAVAAGALAAVVGELVLTLRVAPVNATAAALTVAADVLSRAHKPIALTASVQHSAASVGPLITHFVREAVSIPFRTASAACMAERRSTSRSQAARSRPQCAPGQGLADRARHPCSCASKPWAGRASCALPRAAPAGTDRDVLAALIGLRQSVDPGGSVLRWSPTGAYCNFTGAHRTLVHLLADRLLRLCLLLAQQRLCTSTCYAHLRSVRAGALARLLRGAQCLLHFLACVLWLASMKREALVCMMICTCVSNSPMQVTNAGAQLQASPAWEACRRAWTSAGAA